MINTIIIPILLTFSITLFLVSFANHLNKKKPFFSRRPHWTFNYKPVGWKLLDYSAAMTTTTTLILSYLVLFQSLGIYIPRFLALTVIAGVCVSALTMTVLYFQLIEQYKKISTLSSIVATLVTIGLTIIGSAMADAEIEHLTGVEAGKFPNAQKTLTLTAVVAEWAYIIFWVNVAITCFAMIYLFYKTEPANPTGLNTRDPRGRTPYHAFNMIAGIIFLLFIYSNGVIAAFEDLSTRRTKDWLVKSSFHMPPEHCGIREMPMDSAIALIGDEKAVLAVSSIKYIYTFSLINCPDKPDTTRAYHSKTPIP
ncbi:hypothetical protein [Pseudomonas syringae]|uniref:hypothetical protein n=1 Tax=Pseudomonas syringae TaxID=317 RepID=UPI000AF008AF|nr:hypothetical protein [Pseudomonas syringae]MDY2562506.1 hypothetical protein [Pseudomonas syringae]